MRNRAKTRQSRQQKKGRRPGPKNDVQKARETFLEAFAKVGTITHAALVAGIDRQTHYNWVKADEAYAQAYQAAQEEAADLLEAEARRRALDGVDEPVFYQGVQTGTVRRHSDTLTIFLLKGARPEKFRERYEHSGPNGGPIPTQVTFYIPDNGRA